MIITHHGLQCFRVQFGDTVLAFNPPSKKSKHSSVRFGADITLSSIMHPDFNGSDDMSAKNDEVFSIVGPGEYEVKGVFVKGFLTESEYDGKKRNNTVYFVKLEDMMLCFLGALSTKDLPQNVLEAIDEIDILFVPISGEGVLDAVEASKLAVKLSSKLVIPMHFKDEKDKALQTFLKEMSAEDVKGVDKLTIKQRDISDKEGDVAVLLSSNA